MVFGFGLSLTAIKTLSAVQRAINILKSAGPGAWYDPSDLTTLFQDSAGTTPVTAVEQPVGLILDSLGVLGAELFTGTYTLGAATTATYSGNEATATFGGILIASLSNWLSIPGNAAANGYSEIEFWATYVSGGNLEVGRTWDVGQTITAASNAGVRTRYKAQIRSGYSSGATGRATFGATSAGSVWKVEVISVRELPGNHLIQPTATSRPTLSSRYNLLTKTEQFDDAAWSKTPSGTGLAPVVTQNVALAPDGTMTADRVVFDRGAGNTSSDFSWIAQLPTMLSGASYAAAIWLKADTAGDVGKTVAFRSADNANNIVTLTADWQRVGVTVVNAGGSTGVYNRGTFTTGNSVSVQMWGASLVPASDASLPYQRVNTATDYDFDFSKFPPFLRFDGVDDSMYTAASVDFTSTDKMTVFAGVHKASDVAQGMLIESSSAVSSNAGAFFIAAPTAAGLPGYDLTSKGTTAVQAYSGGTFPAPATSVLSAIADIAGDSALLRVNGVQRANATIDQGTGNFGNYPLYIGRRNNASSPFSGRIYQLAIKGKSLSAAEISTVESFINSKTKAY